MSEKQTGKRFDGKIKILKRNKLIILHSFGKIQYCITFTHAVPYSQKFTPSDGGSPFIHN